MIVAGLDVGNHTTELALAEVDGGRIRWLELLLGRTGGIKGTVSSLTTAVRLLEAARPRPELVVLPELVPVRTSDVVLEFRQAAGGALVALQARGRTPGPPGYAAGRLVRLADLRGAAQAVERPWIVAVPGDAEFDIAAATIAAAMADGREVAAVICAGDDGVVVGNRLPSRIPVVDEVVGLERLPLGARVAVEVAEPGRSVQRLADPLFLEELFGRDGASAVARVVTRSQTAVVAEAEPADDTIPPPTVRLELRDGTTREVDVLELPSVLARDVPAGGLRSVAAGITLDPLLAAIPAPTLDLLAIDLPARHEDWLERGGQHARLGLAALGGVPAGRYPRLLGERLGLPVEVIGSEAAAAAAGAATTPGADRGTAVCDIGAGTVDLATVGGQAATAAGAGDLVTLALAAWAGVSVGVAEIAKRWPAVNVLGARLVEDEHGARRWLECAVPAPAVGGLAVDGPEGLLVLPGRSHSLVEFTAVRRSLKARVLGTSVRRCFAALPTPPARITFAGGGALDPELLEAVRYALPARVLIGRADVGGRFGPRGAVAAGAVVVWRQVARG